MIMLSVSSKIFDSLPYEDESILSRLIILTILVLAKTFLDPYFLIKQITNIFEESFILASSVSSEQN